MTENTEALRLRMVEPLDMDEAARVSVRENDNGSDDSGKTDADKPSDTNTPKGQSDATSKAESPKDGLASTGVAVAVVAVAAVVLAAGAIALAVLGKRK